MPEDKSNRERQGEVRAWRTQLYDQLRQMAARKLACQPPGQTLQATALVALLAATAPAYAACHNPNPRHPAHSCLASRQILWRMGGGVVAMGAGHSRGDQPGGRHHGPILRRRPERAGLVPDRHVRQFGRADLHGSQGQIDLHAGVQLDFWRRGVRLRADRARRDL